MDDAHLYIGSAGQLVVMAELLARGLNVAVPEVDTGVDLYVFPPREAMVGRVQIKTANGNSQRDGYFAQFKLSTEQLKSLDDPPLAYIFAVRFELQWTDFLIISRFRLAQLRKDSEIGSLSGDDDLILRLAFTAADVQCNGTSLQSYRNAWEPWPPP